MESASIRKTRATVINISGALLFLALAIFLLWSLRSIVLPILVGALCAYLCVPVLNFIERKGAPRNVAIGGLFAVLFLFLFFAARQVVGLLPDASQRLELRIRVEYKVNQSYKNLMGLDDSLRRGNSMYGLVGKQLDPLMDRLNLWLFPDKDERDQLLKSQEPGLNPPVVSDQVFQYYVANAQTIKKRQERALSEEEQSTPGQPPIPETVVVPEATSGGGMLNAFKEIVSIWLVTPFVFLFLLLDNGESKRQLIRLVPNQLFELVLTLVHDVDRAIGGYVRGTLLECFVVGMCYLLGLLVLGVQVQWALAIALVTGLANAIPFVGPAVGLALGLAYSLMVEKVYSLVPLVDAANLWLWVLGLVVAVKLVDDMVFQPVVVGRAVHLHPLVVVTGAIGGSILFGIAGMLFAVPAIVVFKVLVTSTLKQLKAYYII